MPSLGTAELLIILLIVIAVFGAGKLANLGGALGKGVKDFKASMQDPDAESKKEAEEKAMPYSEAETGGEHKS
jgi:sec-independent protein translocase protein TatA